MSHFLLSLLISQEKLISNHDLSHFDIPHSLKLLTVTCILMEVLICFPFNKGALYLKDALEMEADAEVHFYTTITTRAACYCSFNHPNNNTNKHPHTSLAFEKSGALFRSGWQTGKTLIVNTVNNAANLFWDQGTNLSTAERPPVEKF